MGRNLGRDLLDKRFSGRVQDPHQWSHRFLDSNTCTREAR
jgi:hypothetical protein